MARVEIQTQGWGTVLDGTYRPRSGASVQIKNTNGTNATTWSAITGGTSSTGSITVNSDGTVSRYIEAGTYDVYVDGVLEGRVEAVNGTASAGLDSLVVVNVKAYGAAGDGTTDDTAAIASAAAAALTLNASIGHVTLDFPSGTYKTTTGLLLRNFTGLTVRGPGKISSSAGTVHVLGLQDCVGFAIRDITVEHSATGARQANADGVNVLNCVDGTISGVRTGYIRSIGVRVQGSKRVTVTGCDVSQTLADGIGVYSGLRTSGSTASISSGSSTLTVNDTTNVPLSASLDVGSSVIIPNAGVAGATLVTTITAVSSSTVATIATPASSTVSSKSVIVGAGSQHVVVQGCHVLGSGDDGIACVSYNNGGGTTWTARNTDVSFIGNTVDTAGARGITVTGSKRFTVASNIVTSPVSNGILVYYDSVGLTTGSQDGTVIGNVVNDATTGHSGSAAIEVQSRSSTYPVDNVTVIGNSIRDGYFSYIYIGSSVSAGTSNVKVIGNTCVGTPGSGSGIQTINVDNVDVSHNYLDGAWNSALSISGTGMIRVQDNDWKNMNLSGSGFGGMSVAGTGPIITGNQSTQTGLGTALDASSATSPIIERNRFASGGVSGGSAPSIASAGTITATQGYSVFTITGTTSINTINGGYAGRKITLIFSSTAGLAETGNIKLAGTSFTGTTDDVVELVFDGTSWFQSTASVN